MDSFAYKQLIERLASQIDFSKSNLPIHFIRTGPQLSVNSFEALKLFLHDIVESFENYPTVQLQLPSIMNMTEYNLIMKTVISLHCHILIFLESNQSSSKASEESRKLAEWLFATPKVLMPKDVADPASLAMFVFLLEGLIYCGWSPNAQENRLKYFAHYFFSELIKNLFHATHAAIQTVYGYIWGAWLLAQQSEGIQDKKPT